MSRRPTGLGQTLKQKLSSLSLSTTAAAQGNPASPRSDDSGSNWASSPTIGRPSPFKKGLFGWNRKEEEAEEEYMPTQDDIERVESCLDRIICQAGVDFETRPMVVITAAALPDPRTISYDLLLVRILAHLDAYVESDYTIVFLAAGGRYTPGWNWVWKAYRSLSRKYRKNLKKLYIVHSTWFSKMLFSLAGAIISPKFFRKIQYIATLSELAENVPLVQIDVAPEVYQENLKHEQQITLPETHQAFTFGVSLEELMGEYGENGGIPRVVKDCAEFIRECGMEVEGIFRRSPSSVLLRQAKEAYDRGQPVSLAAWGDPHIAAVLLKKFFRDLPEPLFYEEMFPVIRKCPIPTGSPGDMATINHLKEHILPLLRTDAAEIVFSYVLHLLHDVSLRSSINLMDARNLAVCFAPTLLGASAVRDPQMCTIPGGPSLFARTPAPSSAPPPVMTVAWIVKICIERYFEIFEEVVDRSEPIQSPGAGVLSPMEHDGSSVPPSPSAEGPDEDESLDDAMLVMPLGPTPPHSNTTTPNPDGTPRSPPTAWKHKHRRMGSSASNGSVVRPQPKTAPGSTRSRGKDSISGGLGSKTGRRSIVSVEKAIGKAGSRGSITIGRGTTRAGGAGVEAVGVTALGTILQIRDRPNTSKDGVAQDNDLKTGKLPIETRAAQLSEVAE
ncbi:hypothetical protein FRC05_002157 [Tulasnella sp. 425]|nr:hypothetical protein FRC05_002157 [Tulasnella sp. 425]